MDLSGLLRPDPGAPVTPDATTAPGSDAGLGDVERAIAAVTTFLDAVPAPIRIVGALVLAALVLRNTLRWRRGRNRTDDQRAEITSTDRTITRVTAFIATAVLSEGMWSFFVDVVDLPWPIRVVLFAFIEFQLLAAARRARRHLYRFGKLGTAPFTVFGLAAASATLAAVHAQSVEERLFRVFAAAVAAHMWIEELREERDILHHLNPGKYPPVRRLVDWQRVGAALGLVMPNSPDVSQIAVMRRIDRLGRLLDSYHAAHTALSGVEKPSALRRWWVARLDRRVVRQTQAACTHINLAESRDVRMMLLRRLSIVRGVIRATNPTAQVAEVDGWIAGQVGGRPVTVAEPIVVDPARPAVSTRPDASADPVVDVPLDGWVDTAPDLGPHLAVDILSGAPTDATPDPAGDTLTDTRPTAGRVTSTAIRPESAPALRPDPEPALPAPRRRLSDRTSDPAPKWTNQQLRAFKLRDEEGLTYEQIARRIGKASKTISRWFKAREEAGAVEVKELAVGPDIVLPLPAPSPPVMSGTNGYHHPTEETPSA